MPLTSTSFVRLTAVLKLVGLAALLFIVGVTIWLVARSQANFDEVVRAQMARAAAVELRNALQDVETGQRGYLLTHDDSYLRPYEDARGRIMPAMRNLQDALSSYPQAAGAQAELEVAVEGKLFELDRTIALARAGQFAEAIDIVNSDTGQAYMDLARDQLDDIIGAAANRLRAGIDGQRAESELLRWVVIIGGILIILVVSASTWAALTYTRELLYTRQQLETTNVRLEERVAERTADLERANEEVQRFAYVVTHDLRAPLVNIMGFTSELEASIGPIQRFMEKADVGTDPEEQEARQAAGEYLPEAIGFIRSSTRKMDTLINAILKLSREGYRPLKPEPVDLAALLKAAAEAIQHQVDERAGSVEVDAGLPRVLSDRLALEQVFGNLLDNAVKYSEPGRPLRIRIRGSDAPGGRVAVSVEDNGRGISEQDHARVFELFRRAGEQNVAGEGIGLAHVRTLVRNLGGEITLTSSPGTGTTFRVTLARDLSALIGSRSQ